MITRRLTLIAAGLCLAMAGLPAWAADRMSFDTKAFEAAQQAGRPIVVHVTAPWYGTCRVQKPMVSHLAARPEFKELAIFDVDFDTHHEALRLLNVRT